MKRSLPIALAILFALSACTKKPETPKSDALDLTSVPATVQSESATLNCKVDEQKIYISYRYFRSEVRNGSMFLCIAMGTDRTEAGLRVLHNRIRRLESVDKGVMVALDAVIHLDQ